MRERGHGPGLGYAVAVALVLLAPSRPAAAAAEMGFQVDPAQDLAELARTGRVAITVDRSAGVYTVDASAVLPVDSRALLEASLDHQGYVRIGVPNLRESHVVDTPAGRDAVYTWSWLRAVGHSSQHYLAVHVHRDLSPAGAVGSRWHRVPRRADWPYPEASAFARLEGSWFLEPRGDGTVYVRYVLAAVLDESIPDALLRWVIARQLRDGVGGVIRALHREAARR